MDSEFASSSGSLPVPHTVVGYEIHSGRTLRLFGEELTRLKAPPYEIGPKSLLWATILPRNSTHLALGWAHPQNTWTCSWNLQADERITYFAGNSLSVRRPFRP